MRIPEKQFSSDVSHELKTHISVILAECEYTLEEARTAEEYQESLETIQKQCQRTMSMIQQLLQISRTINTASSIERENVNLSILCESVAEELSLMAGEKGVRITAEIEPDLEIYADETLIMRLLINLLTNGVKYRRKDADSYVKLILRQESEGAECPAGADIINSTGSADSAAAADMGRIAIII